MKALSLFGWMECGRIALDVLGIPVESYHSSEFDPYPQKLSASNYPDIVHIGDVTKVSGLDYPDVDILFAWPPCQDLSIAGKRAGLEGARSSLFYDFVRILNEAKPKFFLMENVASMPKEAKEEITAQLYGITPVLINSALLSSQNRKRLFWVGKRNFDGTYSRVEVRQPEDRGIVLKDILEDIPFDATNAKGEPVWKPVPEKFLAIIAEKIAKFEKSKRDGCVSLFNTNPSGKWMNGNAFYSEAKWPTVTTNNGEGNKVVVIIPHGHFEGRVDDEKTLALTKSGWEDNNKLIAQFRRTDLRIHAEQDKACTLTANMWTGGNNVPAILWLAHRNRWEGKEPECNGTEKANSLTSVQSDSEVIAVAEQQYLWRKLTVRECARLQTVPESYSFDAVSASRAYKAIGNGWTVEVIMHILKHLDL